MGNKRRVIASAGGARAGATYPFVYLNHGQLDLDSIGKCDGAYIGFVKAVPESLKKKIRDACPGPIRGDASFLDNMLSIESPGDVYDYEILSEFGTDKEKAMSGDWAEFGQETADRFSAAVETWAMQVHQMCPIAFFMGPGNTDRRDPWNAWSRQKFTSTFVPFIDAFIARNPGITADDSQYVMSDIKPLTHGHIACLLQEFDPYHELPVPSEHEARVAELCESFQF
jgi:hypothetical protein